MANIASKGHLKKKDQNISTILDVHMCMKLHLMIWVNHTRWGKY